jgi:hypothetical protein
LYSLCAIEKSVVHAAVVVDYGIDRRFALDQNETRPGRLEKGHAPRRTVEEFLNPTISVVCTRGKRKRVVAAVCPAGTFVCFF